MTRASTQLPFADMPQELSEPIAPTKNILFPIKYQSPLTKIASTLEFRLPENFDMAEKSEPKDMFSTTNGDSEFFMRHNSFRGGATDFAQKYLHKSTDTPCDEDNIDILSHYSEDDSAQEDSCDGDSYQNETSQGTLDQNELTQQLSISS